jgi:hypothetical protein
MSSNGQNTINYYPNDPSASDTQLEQISYIEEDVPLKYKIESDVPGVSSYEPGTQNFEFYQISMTLDRTIKLWKTIFHDAFSSWSSTENLTVLSRVDYHTIPNAKDGYNAFYDQQRLVFFYDTDEITQREVFTCESVDILAHECGHGCLDAVQPDFWNAVLMPEIPAFHEAFGDCSAILTTLTYDEVRKAFLKTPDPLKQSNFVSRLAEQMGHAIFSRYGRVKSSDKSLRDAINDFKYQNPMTLPTKGSDTILRNEPHSFGRVFVGAFYGSLVRVYQLLSEEIPDKDQALRQAVDSIGQIFGAAILSTSVTPLIYKEIAMGMLKADQRLFKGKYRQAINDAFVEKNILASVGLSKDIELHTATGSAKSLNEIQIPADINEIKSDKFAKHVRNFLGISDTKKLDIDIRRGPNLLTVRARYDTYKKLKVGNGDFPDEIEAYIPSGFAVSMDTESGLLSSHAHETDSHTIEEAQKYFQYLKKSDKIHISRDDEKLNTIELAALHKPYYISEDKKILRAYHA